MYAFKIYVDGGQKIPCGDKEVGYLERRSKIIGKLYNSEV